MRLISFVDLSGLWAPLAVVGRAFGRSFAAKPGVPFESAAALHRIPGVLRVKRVSGGRSGHSVREWRRRRRESFAKHGTPGRSGVLWDSFRSKLIHFGVEVGSKVGVPFESGDKG